MKTYPLILPLFIFLNLTECLGGIFKGEEDDRADIKCERTCYRSFNGSCNNLKHPLWGTPETLFSRMFDSYSYEDGKCEIPRLTNPRKISLDFVDIPIEDPIWTLYVVEFGQMLAHDESLGSSVSQEGYQAITCPCVDGKLTKKHSDSKSCAPIVIPKWDPYFTPEKVECFEFERTRSTCEEHPDIPAQQYNAVTSYIDCSPVYGISEEQAKKLRKFKHGLLDYVMIDGKMYPPQAKEGTCNDAGACKPLCLMAGDPRANQNPHIAVMQITLLRLHNYVAHELCKILNTHWDDEKCFQEARRIVIAIIQHITYYEYLPIVLGVDNMKKCDLYNPYAKGYEKGYDDKMNPSTLNEHANAANRQSHSAITGDLKLYDDDRKEHGTVHMRHTFNNVSILRHCDTEMQIAIGAGTQPQLLIDSRHHSDFTVHLFENPKKNVGRDLFSFDIMRGRDHGLATYAYAHEYCGLGKIKSFDDLKHISPENRKIIKRHYDSPDQIELRVGGQLETLLPGTLTGPVFNCIMLKQYKILKFGDYYWYEFEQKKCSLTEDQLKEIRKSTISWLMCFFNGQFSIQPRGFEVPSKKNKIGPCCDLPAIDLTKWQEDYAKD